MIEDRPADRPRADAATGRNTVGGSEGVSFVVPVRNAEQWIEGVLRAILEEDDGRPFEIIVVNDHSRDRSSELVAGMTAADNRVRVVEGPRRGAAAAINTGIRAARFPLIAQVDQDVELEPGWLSALANEFRDPEVVAAQGHYTTDRNGSWWARAAGYDVELRYARIRRHRVDHVCTGNSVYRSRALAAVGLFDEDLGYGYDNRMSYRLAEAGGRLVFNRSARSLHRWREDLRGYVRQQYGQGYGRLDLVWRHPTRIGGDMVSGATMMLHAPLMLLAVLAALAAAAIRLGGGPWLPAAGIALTVVAMLACERLLAAFRATRLVRDSVALFMVPAHLLRDLAWAWAIIVWTWHRLRRRPPTPEHSM